MLTFLTAFLGLVVGVHPVELTVSGDVATVEIRLDGQTVGQLQGEPWSLACDFGSELSPHELVAIGRDADGREIARIAQWINLPRPRSQAEVVLEDADVPRRARLVWHSADAAVPDAWRLSFDGEVLENADPRGFDLPAYDPDTVHVLRAALRFGSSFAHTEIVVGGAVGELVDSELTALLVSVDGKSPTADEMEGWFHKHSRALEVVSVERGGGADIVLVQEATPRLWGKLLRLHKESMARVIEQDPLSRSLNSGIRHGDSLRVLLPVGERAAGNTLRQFHVSIDFSSLEYAPSSMGVAQKQISTSQARGIVATLPYPFESALRDDAPRHVADAVAVAAQLASAGRRQRAVVLMKDEDTRDLSSLSPAKVRRYLERLQVPLLVWSPEKAEPGDPWGEVHNIATSRKFLRGVLKLRRTLSDQLIVWVRGRHLPQDVEMSPAAAQRLTWIQAGGATEIPPELDSEIEQWIAQTSAPQTPTPPPRGESMAAQETETSATEEAHVADPPTVAAAAPEPSAIAEPLDSPTETVLDTVDVRLVNVDVVVTDKEGERRRDLTREDFAIYEDGKKVDIVHFVPPPNVTPAVTPGATTSPQTPSASRVSAEIPRLVIFFDLLRLEAADRKRSARALRDVLQEAPPMQTMIVTYNRGMKIRMPFTSEPIAWADLLEEIERVEPARVTASDRRTAMTEELSDVQRDLDSARTPEELQAAEDWLRSALGRLGHIARELSNEIRSTLAALRQLTASLGGVDGRKILLYVGDNLELAPAQELFEEAQRTVARNQLDIASLRATGALYDVTHDFDDLLREAHAQGVTFYGVTPKNRSSRNITERMAYGSTISSGALGFQGGLTSKRQELVKAAVCRMSIESGGLCQSGGTEPRLLLRKTMEDVESTYSLAYTPEHPADGKFHRLEVEVLRPGLKVRHREGYVDKAAETRLHDRLAAALYLGDAEDALGLTVTAGDIVPPTERPQALVPLEVRVPVDRLGLVPLQGGEKVGVKARLLVKTQNQNGGVSGVQEYPISFQVQGARLAAQPPLVYAHKLHLLLEPGSYQIAIGLWDEISRVGSFLSHEVEVK